ncbi:hypothetical protein [uncultured Nitratireductor sp.]|uniref:hypothetical protein n=1 Tax=uncultured Nitratireductor sp. TaxID=520953 RepID=UPI0025DAD94A|nr:hypothetical protein [uncultured Nitratireductor sp.]
MLTDKLRVFHEAVNAAIGEVGKSAAKIADRVIADAFPETADAAEREGADKMLRQGVIAKITSMLTKGGGDPDQTDFCEIADDFMPIVERLHSHSHYVPLPDVQEYVHVSILIQNPEWLDAARKFKRQKGEETLAEAKVLDELYEAVSRTPSPTPERESAA